MNLPYNEELILNDILHYSINEYIYISSFKRKHNLNYNETIKILRLFKEMNVLKEVYIVSFNGKWIEKFSELSEIPRVIHDEDEGVDISVSSDNLFTCFEVITDVN